MRHKMMPVADVERLRVLDWQTASDLEDKRLHRDRAKIWGSTQQWRKAQALYFRACREAGIQPK